MADSFDFTIPEAMITLGPDRRGRAVIDVTSRLDRRELVGVDIKPDDGVEASWFAAPEPAEFNLQIGETSRTELAVEVPAEVAPGDHRFTVRAFAVSAPSEDFSVSPSLVVRVPEPRSDGGPSIPLWLLAVIGGLALVIVVAVGYFAFVRSQESPAPDLIAMTAVEAREVVSGDFALTEHAAAGIEPDGACVFLQTPVAGRSTGAMSVLLVECPDPAPAVPLPAEAETLCNMFFSFCNDVASVYGTDFANDQEWREGARDMIDRFVEAFRIPGDPAPSLVGLRDNRAEEAAAEAGLELSVSADGSGGTQCVLFQFPYADTPVATGGEIAAVTTRCPVGAGTPDEVVLFSLIDVTGLGNVCDIVGRWCDAVRAASPDPGYVASAEFTEDLAGQVTQFRNTFTGPVVPDVRGLSLGPALAELEAKGLDGRYAFPEAPQAELGQLRLHPCWRVDGQSPPPGTLIAPLDDNVVVLSLEESIPCNVLQSEPLPADAGDGASDDGS
jgi:hypothetical protein